MEMFSPQTDSFQSLNLSLPEANPCCLYVHNYLLVVHSYRYITKFAVGEKGQVVQCSQAHSSPVGKYSNSQPVVDRGLLFICKGDSAVSLNMETGVEVQYFD